MKYSIIFSAFFATALAAPSGARLSERAAQRALRRTNPLIVESAPTRTEFTNSSNIQYSNNWSGAVLTAPPAGSTFTAVSANFIIPNVNPPSDTSGADSWSASAWVGIDGDTYSKAILQTGIDFTVDASGDVTYDAWYEWYPDYAHDFSGIDLNQGDEIKVSVTSTSSSKGSAVIENLTTGKKVSKSLKAPSSSSHLGGQNAEWIVEDFESGSSLVALCDFGTVTFTDLGVSTSSGTLSTGASGSTEIDIKNGKIVDTSVTISSNKVVVSYIG